MDIRIGESLQSNPVLTSHWWWRPGWDERTRYLTWHVTVEGCPEFHAGADLFAGALRPVSALDVVLPRWRHLTLAGVGHAHEVSERARDQLAARVRGRLQEHPLLSQGFELVMDRIDVHREGVLLAVTNAEAVQGLAQLRSLIDDVSDEVLRGGALMPGRTTEPLRPHISLAYANGPGDPEAIAASLRAVTPMPADVRVGSPRLTLMELRREGHAYVWSVLTSFPLPPR